MCLEFSPKNFYSRREFNPWEGGEVLWGKKDRDDHQKSQKITLKNTKPQKFAHPKTYPLVKN